MIKQILLNTLHNVIYYDDNSKDVFFDTNRGWTLLTPLLKDLYPTTKIILCVRDINWILDSFEQLYRKNQYNKNLMIPDEYSTNVYSRCDYLMREDSTIGFAYMGLKQAITSDEKSMIMVVEYEQLCKNPAGMMKAIYNFIGQPYYEHDFDNVSGDWGISFTVFDENNNVNPFILDVIDFNDFFELIKISEKEIYNLDYKIPLAGKKSVTVSTLLTSLLVRSDNQAAEILAKNYPGGRSAFITAMNDYASKYHLPNTRFIDPSGLGVFNISSAVEVAGLVYMASEYEFVRTVSSQPEIYTVVKTK